VNCWLCKGEMTAYISRGQVWCCHCDIIYTDGTDIHIFGIGVPYVLFKGQRYLMDVWNRMLKLKAFW